MGGVPPGEMPHQFQVYILAVRDKNNVCFCVFPFTPNSNGMMFIHLNESTCGPGLVHHRRYKAIVTAKNNLGTTNSTGEILFSKLLQYTHKNVPGVCLSG